ncbi:MAG: TonB family protein [Bacteroidetes bacterium]|nr:TonB family protein [Bacteroidota bacterium]
MKQLWEAHLLLAILFIIYWLFRNKINYRNRRIYLLMLPILSIAIPWLQQHIIRSEIILNLPEVVTGSNYSTQKPPGMILLVPWYYSYYTGTVIMLLFLILKLFKISLSFRNSQTLAAYPGFKITSGVSEQSYSFFNHIHIREGLPEKQKTVVLEHEILHGRLLHSADLILMDIYHAVFWINPLMFLIKRELKLVHEFEVDEKMYQRYQDEYLLQLVAHQLNTDTNQIYLSSLFGNRKIISKRISNMKNKTNFPQWIPILLLVFTVGLSLISWTGKNLVPTKADTNMSPPDSILPNTEPPEFIGGMDAMAKYIKDNIQYPAEAKSQKIEGTVLVSFVVDESGKVTDVKMIKGINSLLDEEAMRVIKNMPDWKPGTSNGKAIKVRMSLPVKFKLD